MTAPVSATGSGLPIDTALEPASVRNGSPAVQKAYAGALEFESVLVQQLSQSLTESSGLGGQDGESESGGGGDPVSTQLSSLLPQTLANGVMGQGGLGLAAQLMGSLDPAAFAVAGGTTSGGASGAAEIAPSGGVPA